VADAGNGESLHQDFRAGIDDQLACLVDVIDRERALETPSGDPIKKLSSLLERAAGSRVFVSTSLYLEEAGQTIGGERPPEHGFIKAATRLDVVGVDGEMAQVCRHGLHPGTPGTGIHSMFRQIMSDMRHDDPVVRSYSVTHPAGDVELPTQAGWDQVIYTKSGLLTALTSRQAWTVLPHRALCVGDGSLVRLITRNATAVQCLYVRTSLGVVPPSIRVINVSALSRELLLYAVDSCPLRLDSPAETALITLLAEQLGAPPEDPLRLPLPVDSRARLFADHVIGTPANPLSVAIAAAGASRRTLERLFRSETDMALGAWQRRARVLASVEAMASGASVTSAALAVGYATPSSFVAAFKLELGVPPRVFMSR